MSRPRSLVLLVLVFGSLGMAGCVSSDRYDELQRELAHLRYQYRLERLYVSGLKAQNQQLQQRRDRMRSDLQERQATAAPASLVPLVLP